MSVIYSVFLNLSIKCVNRNVKKFFNIYLILSLSLIVSSCALFRNPDKSWNNAKSKLDNSVLAIQKNDNLIAEQGKAYIYGTKLALYADPSTNKFHEVATVLNDKAIETLGTPKMEEINMLRIMVANLLSTNSILSIKGEKQLQALDSKIINLQDENESLKLNLAKAEKKIIDVGTVNAGYASKWTSMIKIFWYAVYFVVAGFVIKIVAAVVPPPYNSIISIVSIPLGLVIKSIKAFVPEAIQTAGVVKESLYNNTKLALENVVAAVENHKKDNPQDAEKLAEYLKDTTSKELTRPIIYDIKRGLKF